MQVDRPRIIAEIGCNHMGDKSRAIDMARQACDAGADWVKFQHFNPSRLALARLNPEIEKITVLSIRDLADVLKKIPADRRMVTVFDRESAREAFEAGATILKVGHIESRDSDFLEFVRGLCPNFVYATTDTSLEEIRKRVLYTIGEYPCEKSKAKRVAWVAALVGAGYSDHTPGDDLSAARYAVDMKCWATEIHVHEDGCAGCVDHAVSKSMSDLELLVECAKRS